MASSSWGNLYSVSGRPAGVVVSRCVTCDVVLRCARSLMRLYRERACVKVVARRAACVCVP